jgi:hypothetical protein
MSTASAVLPISATLVPSILRARGMEVSKKRLLAALCSGAIPGRREQWRWILTPEDVDAAELYFRKRLFPGSGVLSGRKDG